MTHQFYISIGSNTPDREDQMAIAIESLNELFEYFTVSHIYETPCYRGQGKPYLNAVARGETCFTAEEVTDLLKRCEDGQGRQRDEQHRNVVSMDIDLVIFGNEVLRERDFGREYFRRGYFELTDPRDIHIDKFVYDLPDECIARHPLAVRDSCKLLVADRDGVIADTVFNRVGDFLPADSLLIYNNTRVINARLRFHKSTGATIEIFTLEPVSPADYQPNFASFGPVSWKCLVGNSKRWKSGELTMSVKVCTKDVVVKANRIVNDGADSIIEFSWDADNVSFSEIIEAAGEIPIPPYLNRSTEATDSTDYQTVFGRIEGSVAAPTAGLHFTDELLDSLSSQGIERREVTLHVGAGTFQPVKSDTIGDHPMHAEYIDVKRDLIAELATTTREVTAVGTTSVRTLESLYHIGCQIAQNQWAGTLDQWYPYSIDHPNLTVKEALEAIVKYLDSNDTDRLIASTRIIIAPGYRYRIVKRLITNFHQPGSTLLLLVSAIIGDTWREVYEDALAAGYRFLSYGDACLLMV